MVWTTVLISQSSILFTALKQARKKEVFFSSPKAGLTHQHYTQLTVQSQAILIISRWGEWSMGCGDISHITGIAYVFHIKKLLYKMYGTTSGVEPELLGNFEYTSVQSRPLPVSGKFLTLRRALIVLISKLTGISAGLAFLSSAACL